MIYFTAARTAQIDADEALNKRYARIMYTQLNGTITASDAAPGTDAANMNDPLTYNFYTSNDSAAATITIDYGQTLAVDGVCIVCDEPLTNLWTVTVQYFDGASFVDWDGGEFGITGNGPIMFNGTLKATSQVRVIINTSISNVPATVRGIYTGNFLVMQRAIYGGHTPITLAKTTTIRPNRSEGGQWLGRTAIRSGLQTSYDWDNLTAQWYRDNFSDFVDSAILKPFYIAWKPDRFPNETAYCWTQADIAPTNTGTRDLMSVSVPVKGYSNDS